MNSYITLLVIIDLLPFSVSLHLDCGRCDFRYTKDFTIDPKIPYTRKMDTAASDILDKYLIFPSFRFPYHGQVEEVKFISEDLYGAFEIGFCLEVVPNEQYRIDYSIFLENQDPSIRKKRSPPYRRNMKGNVIRTHIFSTENKLSKASFTNTAQNFMLQGYESIKVNNSYVLGIGFTNERSTKNQFIMFSSSQDVKSPVLKMVNPMVREALTNSTTPNNYIYDFKLAADLNLVPGLVLTFSAMCPTTCFEHEPFYGLPVCDSQSGNCIYGCDAGWSGNMCSEPCPQNVWGGDCQQKCPTTCKDNICDTFTGSCQACDDGYYGTRCQFECGHCSNTSTCGSDGTCLYGCNPGFLPPVCAVCKDGYYQNNNGCIVCGNCLDSQPCDKGDGSCYAAGGCAVGFMLPHCKDSCPKGTFGFNCTNKCGQCQSIEDCNAMSGTCKAACAVNWFGPQCSVSQASSQTAVFCQTAVGLLQMLAASICCVICSRLVLILTSLFLSVMCYNLETIGV